MKTRPDLMQKFVVLLHDQAKDVAGVDNWNAPYFPAEVKQAVAADFKVRHGDDAIPVQNLSESAEVGHLGKTGVIVSPPLKALLETVLGTTAQAKELLREAAQKLYGWHDLDDTEQENLTRAIDLVSVAAEISLDEIDVSDFRDPGTLGRARDGRILLARRILSDRKLTRLILVHEVAHRNGDDGEKNHVVEIERIHTEIEEHLINLGAGA